MATHRYSSIWVSAVVCSVLLTALMMWSYGNSRVRAGGIPTIDRENTILKGRKKQLIIRGDNFEAGATVEMESQDGAFLSKGAIQVLDRNTITIDGITKDDTDGGVLHLKVRNADGSVSARETIAVIPSAIGPSVLTQADIETILGQAAAAAQKLGFPGTFAVLDREGNVLALFQM